MTTKKSSGGSNTSRTTSKRTGKRATSTVLTRGLQTEHKVVHEAQVLDHDMRMAQVLGSGNARRIRRYFLRRIAYKLFAKVMGKTLNRL